MNYRCLFSILILFLGFAACTSEPDPEQQEQKFKQFTDRFVEALWKQYPQWAAYNGYYKYAAELPPPTNKTRGFALNWHKAYLDSLEQFNPEALSNNLKSEYLMIENMLKAGIWQIEEFKSHEWDASQYNIANPIYNVLLAKSLPLDDKMRNISTLFKSSNTYYEAAKKNLTDPVPELLNLAVQQTTGAVTSLTAESITDSLNASSLSDEEKAEFKTYQEKTRLATKDFLGFINSLSRDATEPDAEFRSYRIGEKLFEKKFKYDIVSQYSAAEINTLAYDRKAELHGEMTKISREIWSKYFPEKEAPSDSLVMIKQLIEKISERHVTRKEFVNAIRKQIPELTAFVNEKDLLTLDPKKPLEVRETPLYMRGFAGASISAPGPYDANANTYYNVTPLDDYSEEAAESYLREYNYYILQILNIHEAIPGHYAQLVESNKSPSLIKSILGNGAMIEGWAVYVERMMLEEGYKESPEMWLMYGKWNLRVVCNTIIDYGIQTQNMSEEEVMDILLNQAFQERAEAEGKWRRATYSQVQLCSYFTGSTEIYNFREELKEKLGDRFDLKAFHEAFLSYGSAPVKYVREMMLADLDSIFPEHSVQ